MYMLQTKSSKSLQSFLLTATLTLIVSIGLTTGQQAFAQVNDSFDDGDFTSNPVWLGAEGKSDFKVEGGQLRLDAPSADAVSYLSTLSNVIDHTIWEFYVKMNFATSNTSLTRVYLVSDQQNLSGSLNGYFVEIGNTPDEVSLYKQTRGVSTPQKIIDGNDGRVGQSTVTVRVKVTRDDIGNWRLFTDVGLTGTYMLEGSVFDNTHLNSTYFGIYCKYIASRSTLFFFDDFRVDIDRYPPEILTATPTSDNTLLVTFSEVLNTSSSSASIPENYFIEGFGHPSRAELIDQTTVQLTFTKELPNGIESTLKVSGIGDEAGNVMTEGSKTFFFFKPLPVSYRDIIITEIFADPNPTIGLPEAEFIELYNRSKNPISLKGWKVTDGSSTGTLSDKILLPSEYLILCPTSATSAFSTFSKPMGVSNFPTLNNTGDAIVIRNSEGLKIDSVNYSLAWYKDDDKREGGWTLELIDPENLCAEETNWAASEDERGGTPGSVNSVFANKPDVTPPQLISVIPLSENKLLVSFNEKLDARVPEPSAFSITDNLVSSVAFAEQSLKKIELQLSTPLEKGEVYELALTNIYDCSGNRIEENNRATFGLPEAIEQNDIIINEVLFNPRPTGVDFVEMYNRSAKYLNLKKLSIANIKNGKAENLKVISTADHLVSPGEYFVLTSDPNVLKGEYIKGVEQTFIQVRSMPSMNDDEGSIALVDTLGNVIDSFFYTDKMHSLFIKDNEGVSLERIAFNAPTNEPVNWKSASSTSGFATPGYVNSNSVTETILDEQAVEVNPEIFLPLSGDRDFAQINYRFDKGGFVANVKVYNPQGVTIKNIAQNEILSSEGFFRWDGDKDNGTKASIGSYVIVFEVFDDQGHLKIYKKRVAIAGRF